MFGSQIRFFLERTGEKSNGNAIDFGIASTQLRSRGAISSDFSVMKETAMPVDVEGDGSCAIIGMVKIGK